VRRALLSSKVLFFNIMHVVLLIMPGGNRHTSVNPGFGPGLGTPLRSDNEIQGSGYAVVTFQRSDIYEDRIVSSDQ
jgi:hypothetical protein